MFEMNGGRTKYAILSLVRLGPMSGAEIRSFCKSRFSHFWNESYGQIYPALAAMAKAGLVVKIRDGARGKSVLYRITPKGVKEHARWVSRPPSPRSVRDELILKLFSGGAGDAAGQLDHIAAAEAQANRQLAEIKSARAELKRDFYDAPDFPYWTLMLRAGELANRARLQWCREAADVIRNL